MTLNQYIPDCIIIGRNSCGANGNVGAVGLAGNIELIYTAYRIDDANGENYQHRGISPDIYVEDSYSPNKKDMILSTALEYLFSEGQAVVK